MRNSKKKGGLPSINASSMADIAFLLLVFFLVSTEIKTDEGVSTKLPHWDPETTVEPVNARNILSVRLNSLDQLMVENEMLQSRELRELTKKFLANNKRNPQWSDSPQRAVVHISGDRATSYEKYIEVYNEIRGAYNELRDAKSLELYKKRFNDLENDADKEVVRKLYPMQISEEVYKVEI